MRAFPSNRRQPLVAGLWRGTRLVLASVAWSALAMSGARAEIKATDCSIAISGTTAFSSQTIHCLSEDQIGRVIDVLVSRGVILRAADAGLGIATVRTLAKRIKPTQQLEMSRRSLKCRMWSMWRCPYWLKGRSPLAMR